jgi:hypothetical protein
MEELIADISFVCCIEAGSLEVQTTRMVESLRRHGGRFANAPVLAVTPRLGPALSASTLRKLSKLKVRHIRQAIGSGYEWFNFLNKPLALVAAEPYISTGTVSWLDSDILFVGEPTQLHLTSDEDFSGFPVEIKEMGSTGPGDDYEPLWQKACDVLGINIDSLPFQKTFLTGELVRLYFNGGIFSYRIASGFSHEYLKLCLKLLDSNITTKAEGYNIGFKEMSSIGFAVVKLNLQWRALPYSHDHVVMSRIHRQFHNADLFREARVLHYHDAMWPYFWPTFYECLDNAHPQVAQWLGELGPMRNEAGVMSRLTSKCLRLIRARKAFDYERRCTVV